MSRGIAARVGGEGAGGGMTGKGDRGARTLMWLMGAVLMLALGAAMIPEFRAAQEREREFRAAPVCASVPVEVSNCRWKQKFTVRSVDLHRGSRHKPPEAELLLPSRKPWHVTFRNTNPVLSGLEPHDKVVGLIWRGDVVDLRDTEGEQQETSDGPLDWPTDRLAGALACLSFGAAALVGSLWSALARGNRCHDAAGRVVRLHGIPLGITALLTLWLQSANDWPARSLPIIWGIVAALILANMVGFVVAALRGQIARAGGEA
ncbi:hypothetical protein [Streptomyces endophyticus]|uniref:DUF3592 domain-containing protein n=1 Tax=Streptomyces endophyticus TaxID=714166 RepID=A0ABU6EWD4_9ACTN|nr:hypothetical protein [Streptomyces endophyticus]MEB8336056.1 hypothetical protein [Streptomyces endophyticus]